MLGALLDEFGCSAHAALEQDSAMASRMLRENAGIQRWGVITVRCFPGLVINLGADGGFC